MRFFERLTALFFLIILSPFFLIIAFLIKITSKGPVFFYQKRAGLNKKPFIIYKFRTMIEKAENLKKKYQHLNQADGPVFKIANDPRYTKIGKVLGHSGLDELPQLINILKGEMAFIGPRPLPVKEAAKVPKKYEKRFSVLPGISSLWVAEGTDHSDFDNWMKLDLEYVKRKSLWYDFSIILRTIFLIVKLVFRTNQ